MRVQDPAKYAQVLFNIARPGENWTADKIQRMFGAGEQDINAGPDLGPSDIRPPSLTMPASCRPAATSTISTAARWPRSRASAA